MKTSYIALLFYFMVVFAAVVANIVGNPSLMLVSKPFVIPAIYFYYFINSKKVSITFSIMLFFCYLGTTVSIFSPDNEIYYLLGLFFISNIILIYIIFKNKVSFKFSKIALLSIVINAIFLISLWLSIMDLLQDLPFIIHFLMGIYGVSILFINFLVALKCIQKITTSLICLFVYVVCILVSDVFYALYTFEVDLIAFDIIHFTVQMISFFFLVQYVLEVEKNPNNLD